MYRSQHAFHVHLVRSRLAGPGERPRGSPAHVTRVASNRNHRGVNGDPRDNQRPGHSNAVHTRGSAAQPPVDLVSRTEHVSLSTAIRQERRGRPQSTRSDTRRA